MSRNKIECNQRLFGALDQYCAEREEPIGNAGRPRWMNSSGDNDGFLENAKLQFSHEISFGRGFYYYVNGGVSYIFTVGFYSVEFNHFHVNVDEVPVDEAKATVVISEQSIAPVASSFEVKNYVEVGDGSVDGYDGHQWSDCLENVFPPIYCFAVPIIPEDEFNRSVFSASICLSDEPACWISPSLVESLSVLRDIDLHGFPYQTLSRSVFDNDPGALFLALYRCLEALYSYEKSLEVKNQFSISADWEDISFGLDKLLGWRPREEDSLVSLFSGVAEKTKLDMLDALNESFVPGDNNLDRFSARRVYSLRNNLVHYRAGSPQDFFGIVKWEKLIQCMISAVFDVYYDVRGSRLERTSQTI